MRHVFALTLAVWLASISPAKANEQVLTYKTDAQALVTACLKYIHAGRALPDELLALNFQKRKGFGWTIYTKISPKIVLIGRDGKVNAIRLKVRKRQCQIFYVPANGYAGAIMAEAERLTKAAGYTMQTKLNARGKPFTSYVRDGNSLKLLGQRRSTEVYINFFDYNR